MKIRMIFGDQLSEAISSLSDLDKDQDVVLMAEVLDEATYVQHHKKKLVLIFSAMRHFAKALTANGINVDYVKLDDEENTGVLQGELARCLGRHDAEGVVVSSFETQCGAAAIDTEDLTSNPIRFFTHQKFRQSGAIICLA